MNTNFKASFEVFNENSDFSLWKTRMKAHLGLAGLKGIIDDFSSMNTIISHVGDVVLRKIDHCKTAAEMWETLNKLYMETFLLNQIYVQLKFYSFKLSDTKTINENVNEFLKIVAELNSLEIVV